jgi:hypothetical protein
MFSSVQMGHTTFLIVAARYLLGSYSFHDNVSLSQQRVSFTAMCLFHGNMSLPRNVLLQCSSTYTFPRH